MVSSLLGGFPLKVDAIPDENGFIPDGKGSQITNRSHTRPSSKHKGKYNSSGFLPEASPTSMDTRFSTVDVPDQQTVDSMILAANRDNAGYSIQPENPERLRDTGYGLGEPFNDAFSTAYDDLMATGFTYDEVTPFLSWQNRAWFEQDNFQCKICGETFTRRDNFKRHIRQATKNCKAAWGCLDKAAQWRIVNMSWN